MRRRFTQPVTPRLRDVTFEDKIEKGQLLGYLGETYDAAHAAAWVEFTNALNARLWGMMKVAMDKLTKIEAHKSQAKHIIESYFAEDEPVRAHDELNEFDDHDIIPGMKDDPLPIHPVLGEPDATSE